MEFLGVGPLELFFILIIALIILGPNDMVKAGRTIGKFLRQLITSPNWRILQQTSQDLRSLPNKLIRDAGIDEEIGKIKEISEQTAGELKGLTDSVNAATSSLPALAAANLKTGADPSTVPAHQSVTAPSSESANLESLPVETQESLPPVTNKYIEEDSENDPSNDSV